MRSCVTCDRDLKKSLQLLAAELPDQQGDPTLLQQWWSREGPAWSDRMRQAQMRFRHLVYDCQFSPAQLELLEQYYRANLLLVNCLNSDCRVSQTNRDRIEATLFCPLQVLPTPKP